MRPCAWCFADAGHHFVSCTRPAPDPREEQLAAAQADLASLRAELFAVTGRRDGFRALAVSRGVRMVAWLTAQFKAERAAEAELREERRRTQEALVKAQRSVEHAHYWYGCRLERLRDLAREHGCEDAFCNIVANGTADASEPPTYQQMHNALKNERDAAQAELAQERGRTWEAWWIGSSWRTEAEDFEAERDALVAELREERRRTWEAWRQWSLDADLERLAGAVRDDIGRRQVVSGPLVRALAALPASRAGLVVAAQVRTLANHGETFGRLAESERQEPDAPPPLAVGDHVRCAGEGAAIFEVREVHRSGSAMLARLGGPLHGWEMRHKLTLCDGAGKQGGR